MIFAALRKVLVIPLIATLLGACNGPSPDDTVVVNAPSADTFTPVSPVLEIRCGTLDCHGSSARNLRTFGINGARLDPMGITGDQSTTPEEVLATYASVISVQPEVLNRIVNEGGLKPERWLLITKGRGTEYHKGGSRMLEGDDSDRCITSWVAGAVDVARCELGAALLPPGGEEF
jgi:hypothetical protein